MAPSPVPQCSRALRTGACVVIAALDEQEVVSGVVAALRKHFGHVVVVDDGSSDETALVARLAGAYVLQHPVNLGQGAALLTGIRHARQRLRATHVVTFDADGQHRPEDAAAMVDRAVAEDLQVVLGSRFLGACNAPRHRRALLRAAVRFTRHTTGLQVTDAHNGLRVLRHDAADALVLRQHGMSHASEILAQVAAHGWTWAEHPVTIDYSEYSRAKGQPGYNALNIAYDLAVAKIGTPA